MQASLLRKPVAALCALSLLVLQPAAHAGDLNTEVTNMFNNLGAVGNYTAPGAFKGQTFNTFTGGNLYLRSPNKTYQLAAIQFPSAKGGCGGIDLFGGSFSHISAAEFRNMLRNITAALPEVPAGLAGVRGDVSDRAATASRAGSAADTFDTRNEITRNPDGTISTRRSQMLGNARQLREDVANMAENASDLVAGGSEQALSVAAAARARNSESQRSRDIAATPDVPTMLPKGGRRKR